jgi:hypothetical protein
VTHPHLVYRIPTAVVCSASTGATLSTATQTAERVECIAVDRWIYDLTLNHIGDYWLGHCGEHGQSSPASSVLFTFGLEP